MHRFLDCYSILYFLFSLGSGIGSSGPQWYEMTENSRCSEGDESIADFSLTGEHRSGGLPHIDDIGGGYDFLPPNAVAGGSQRTSFLGAFRGERGATAGPAFPRLPDAFFQPAALKEIPNSGDEGAAAISGAPAIDEDITSASDMMLSSAENKTAAEMGPTFPPEEGRESGLFMYIDIHGHASKRGIFMYGNHFANPETKMDSLLFPKLMSINCANFDFPACNFTEESVRA
jgi:hypothetical protein